MPRSVRKAAVDAPEKPAEARLDHRSAPARRRACARSPHEPLFARLVAVIFAEGMLRNGSVVDCGAHQGGESCLYADLAPDRIVHAVEPLLRNARAIAQRYADRRNIAVMHAALGSRERVVSVSSTHHTSSMLVDVQAAADATDASAPGTFAVHRLDDLFIGGPWSAETFGFGHFDVEGAEADVLEGGAKVIARDRPVFTFEADVLGNPDGARALLRRIEGIGYSGLLVPETCGLSRGCRNFICVPHGRRVPAALGARTLPVDSESFSAARARNLSRHGRAYVDRAHPGAAVDLRERDALFS